MPILFVLMGLAAGAASAGDLNPDVLRRVVKFRAAECAVRLHDGHASVVRLHEATPDHPRQTGLVVLIMHGLFRSPRATKALENFFFEKGANVVNLRLHGHYEVDTSVLAKSIAWADWRRQSQDAFALARELGDKVLLVGHSTGALLGIWLAADHADDVAGLAVFAPAFGLSGHLRRLLTLPLEAPVPGLNKRIRTIHAGREVELLGAEFRGRILGDQSSFESLAERLASVPIWMANTNADTVIDLAATRAFAITTARTGGAPRAFINLNRFNGIAHDHLAGPSLNWRWPTLLNALSETFYPR